MDAGETISATTLRLFFDAVENLGVDRQMLLDACGIEASSLEDMEKRITQSTYESVFLEAELLSEDPAIGLHAGEQVHPRAVNLFGYLMLSSATLLDGMRRIVRYQGLLTDVLWIRLEEESDPIRMIIDDKSFDPECRPSHAEYTLALIVAVASWVSEYEVRPIETRYVHNMLGNQSEYERVMRGPVRFLCEANELLFAPNVLSRPSVHHDRVMEQLHVDFAEWLLATAGDHSVSGEVRRILSRSLEEGAPELVSIARHLGMSARSLQRRLASEGTSFRVVLERLRRDLARAHLEDLGTPVAEVAYLTGFSEVSAFSRAARRWFGQTPGRMRRHAAREPANDHDQSA